ncbi:unnamed protein product [Fraxinus pennsylvanica]|uniref:Uncharacterized protein n=1 Tax=Fraxinus pennsylvanica TaxID=56036 RepID=A0AAD2DXQ2_9LAMI|nr:unnamed protein product [Fraxinus pennsylvanica]
MDLVEDIYIHTDGKHERGQRREADITVNQLFIHTYAYRQGSTKEGRSEIPASLMMIVTVKTNSTKLSLSHADRDGQLEEVVLRHLGAEDGNTVIAKNVRYFITEILEDNIILRLVVIFS